MVKFIRHLEDLERVRDRGPQPRKMRRGQLDYDTRKKREREEELRRKRREPRG